MCHHANENLNRNGTMIKINIIVEREDGKSGKYK
jgi:hypothetical protein